MGLTIYLFPLAAENTEVIEEEESIPNEDHLGYLHATITGPNEGEFFKEIYRALRTHGLKTYREPVRYPKEIDGYWSREASFDDFTAFYEFVGEVAKQPRLQRHQDNFRHLLNHSCFDGLFVPVEFQDVIKLESNVYQTDIDIGSSHQLKDDMEALAQYLGLPLDRFNYELDCDGESFIYFRELENEYREIDPLWLHHRTVAQICISLYHASLLSIRFNTAVCFG